MRDEIFVVILEQLEQQMSAKEALEQLRYSCTVACKRRNNNVILHAKMVSSILSIFTTSRISGMYCSFYLITVDPHCCKYHRTKIELDRWLGLEPSLLLSKSPYPVNTTIPRETTSTARGMLKVENNSEKIVKEEDNIKDEVDDSLDSSSKGRIRRKKRKSVI